MPRIASGICHGFSEKNAARSEAIAPPMKPTASPAAARMPTIFAMSNGGFCGCACGCPCGCPAAAAASCAASARAAAADACCAAAALFSCSAWSRAAAAFWIISPISRAIRL
jgi:hypothetical protein